jgi:hypothetical protein
MIAHRPADDLSGEEIEHGGQVEPTFFGWHITYIGKPYLIGTFGGKFPGCLMPSEPSWHWNNGRALRPAWVHFGSDPHQESNGVYRRLHRAAVKGFVDHGVIGAAGEAVDPVRPPAHALGLLLDGDAIAPVHPVAPSSHLQGGRFYNYGL